MQRRHFEIDLFSLAMLFLSITCFIVALVGVVNRGTAVWVVLPPIALGIFAILTLEKK